MLKLPKAQLKTFYLDEILKFVDRLTKCIEKQGESKTRLPTV
jgi:hypothetical protein